MDKSLKKRTNTYLNKEYFKIITLAYSLEQTHEFSKFLSGTESHKRGVFNAPYQKTNLIIFPRFVSKMDHQATTVAVEAMIIYLDKREEFNEIKSIIHRYGLVPIRLIVSDFDATDLAEEIDARWFQKPENPKDLIDYVNELDKEEFLKIKKEFDEADKDEGGYIDPEELKAIAIKMGFKEDDENFNKSVYALDLNQDGNISLNEFITWWKIGRQNVMALPKIYDLYHGVNNYITNILDLKSFSEDINRIEEEQLSSVSKQRLLFRSPGIYKLKSFVEFSLAVGAKKRQEMAIEFLSKFTKNTGSAKANWVSILIPLNSKQKKIDPQKGKLLLDEFKESCLKWGEEKMGSAFISFFKNLLVFETNNNENSIILAIRLKLDIEALVKSALQHIIYIFSHLQKKEDSTWFQFKAHSNLDLYDAINEDLTFSDFFEVSELIIEGSTFRDQIKAIYNSLNKEHKEIFSFLQFFFNPRNIDLELECKLEDYFTSNNSWLKNSLKNFGLFLDFLKTNLSKELLAAADDLEIALNCFDIFARFKIYTQSTFNENTNAEKNL